MLNCQEVSRLVSDSIDRKLSLWQRMNLWMHLSMCGLCWGFRRYLLNFHEQTHLHASQIEEGVGESQEALSDEARERIKQALKSQS
jgi:hypothetical protein